MPDVTLTITISSDKAEVALERFLAERSMPMIDDPENPGQKIPEFTPKEFIVFDVKRYLHNVCNKGKKKLESIEEDNDLFV